MRKIDDFVIDRVFQPVADSLARWASCYALAAFLITGFGVVKTFGYVYFENWIGLAVLSTYVPFTVWRCHRLEAAPPSDVLPIDRAIGVWARSTFLICAVLLDPFCIVADPSLRSLIVFVPWYLFYAGVYLMACRRNPPKPRRVHATSGKLMTEVGVG